MSHDAECGEGKCRVWVDVIGAGSDIVVYIGGGDKPHIGSMSLSEKGNQPISFSVPEHKDYFISHEASKRIARAIGGKCLVISGIHVDGASALEIKTLVENSSKCVGILIERMCLH